MLLGLDPGIVHGGVIVDSLNAVLADLRKEAQWPAYLKLKELVDSLLPFCCTMGNGEPIPSVKGDLKVKTKLETASELNELKKKGTCRAKIALIDLFEDLEEIRRRMEQNKYGGVKEDLEQVLLELKKLGGNSPGLTGSKYEFVGGGIDLILSAREEVINSAKTLFVRYIREEDCRALLEKYIEEAYFLGRNEKFKEGLANR